MSIVRTDTCSVNLGVCDVDTTGRRAQSAGMRAESSSTGAAALPNRKVRIALTDTLGADRATSRRIQLRLFGLLFVLVLVSCVGCGTRRADRTLLRAVGNCDLTGAKQALAAGANVNCTDGMLKRWTPLLYAVNANDEAMVSCLLSSNANPNVCDASGFGPLFYALSIGEDTSKIIEGLLRAGASTQARGVLAAKDSLSDGDPKRRAYELGVASGKGSKESINP